MKLDLESYSMQTKNMMSVDMINRELSWLAFNERVLTCAIDKKIPLNERFKFLAITASNLDEFISVRYSQYDADDPIQKEIRSNIKRQMILQRDSFNILCQDVRKMGIKTGKIEDLSKKARGKVQAIFNKEIFPMLTPTSVGSTKEIPNLYNGQSVIALLVKNVSNENLILIPIPKSLKRYHIVDDTMLMIEDIIIANINHICVNKVIEHIGHFRVNKDFSICLNHDTSKFILDRMIETIEERNSSNPIFMVFPSSTPKQLKRVLVSMFGIKKYNVFQNTGMIDYTRFMSPMLGPEHSYEPFTPYKFDVASETHSIFTVLQEKDILLHHPYDAYDTVIKFIEHASMDPKVRTIKQTLYRVSSEDSPVINALCTAAKQGKSVTVLIEIKARFDETQNISLIQKLKRHGVNVVLGFENLKTHCKMCIVVRDGRNGVELYSHIATGNYNEKTAKQYTDLSYLTSKPKIGNDLLGIFNILSGISTPDSGMKRVFYAPINLRKRLIKCIDREIDLATKGKDAEIFLKLNSLNDPQMIKKLYEAASKGVRIYIICRGICCILPKNGIYIKSIVGRFLEHSRIYYFKNNGDREYYISSADLLTRNLDRRVEILFNVRDPYAIRKLKHIVNTFKEDTRNSYRMQKDGTYRKIVGDFDSQQYFIDKSTAKPRIGKK